MSLDCAAMMLVLESGQDELERINALLQPWRGIGNRGGELSREDKIRNDHLRPGRARFVGGSNNDVVGAWLEEIPAQGIHRPVLVEIFYGGKLIGWFRHRDLPWCSFLLAVCLVGWAL